ncbi:MAG: ArnT family glycosyltransferase [Myxococcota bacterium]
MSSGPAPAVIQDLPEASLRPGSTPVPDLAPEPRLLRLVLWLLAVALVPRLLLMSVNENYFGDAVARTELAARWVENPRWMSSFEDGAYQFGPLHLYLVGLALRIWPAPEHAGRALSLVFGTLTVLPLFFLTRRYFGWRAGVWACLALSVWGLHLQVSTTAASEALSLFLVLWSLTLFAKGVEENHLGALIGSALVLNLACATRYESWMLMPLLAVALVLSDKDKVAAITRAVVFGLVCLPFPMVWMQGNELAKGDPFYPVTYIEQFHRQWFTEGVAAWGQLLYRLQNLFFWPGVAFFTLTPLVALCGAVGMWRAWQERPMTRWLLFAAWVPTLYFTTRSALLGTFSPLARFALAQVALLLPFLKIGFDHLFGQSVRRRVWAGAAVVLAVGTPIALGSFTFRQESLLRNALRPVSPTSTNPPAVMEVARFIKKEVKPRGGKVILDADKRYLDLQIAFFGGLPESRMVRYRWGSFSERLQAVEPDFLVLTEGGMLQKDPHFERKGRMVRLGARVFSELLGFQRPFRVYRRH